MLTATDIRKSLNTKLFGKKIYTFETIDSTNDCAQMLAEQGAEEGIVVFAEKQTKGRGRLGRIWESEAGKNIMFSVILRPKFAQDQMGLIGFLIAVSVAEAIEKNINQSIELKWPNDLLINSKKFCGILLEASFQQGMLDFIIVGIGVNVNQTTFSKELKEKATSLKLECGREFDRSAILRDILESLEVNYLETHRQGFNSIIERWAQRCHIFDKEIRISHRDKIITGKVVRLNSDGGLIVKLPDQKEIKVMAGDATVVG